MNPLKTYIREAVVDLQKFRQNKSADAYELIIGKFIATSQSGVEKLQFAKEFIYDAEKSVFDDLLKEYRQAASTLSAFLRAKRLRLRQ